MSKQIQWFPGHMAKARREISEKIKLIDIVIELVDARAPLSSKNPMFDQICNNKPRLIVMTKKDLADERVTNKWIEYFKKKNIDAICVNLKNFNEYQLVINISKEILKEKMEREAKRGLKPRAMRAMVLGIPNVGYDLASDRGNFELFDTPGVLWPRFEDINIARNIALIGSIKQDILPLDELFIYAVKYLEAVYPKRVMDRYDIEINFNDDWVEKAYDNIAKNRKIKPVRGYTDYDRVMEVFFNDIFDGSMGKITWERPDDTL